MAPLLIIYSIIFKFCKDKVLYPSWIVINILIASIIIFCCLVYNEIIVLKCYGLDKNTYAEITERSNSENSQGCEFQTNIGRENTYDSEGYDNNNNND